MSNSRSANGHTSYIGSPVPRFDGRAKVTGAAKYAAEFKVDGLAYGAVVESTIAKGSIESIDTSEAMKIAGVLAVVTHESRPKMASSSKAYQDDVAPGGEPYRPLYDGTILFNGQPVALVLAEDWETAQFAASRVRVTYKTEPHTTDLHAVRDKAETKEKPAKPRGKADKALAGAATRHEADYFIPTEHHNPMELFAATVVWEGDGKLTVYDKTQGTQNVQQYLCNVFSMKPKDLRVMSPYVGGAFGSGLRPQYECVLAVLGAKALERSVRLVLTRRQMYGLGHRPATIEHLALGAKADGTLDVIIHEAIAETSRYEDFARNDTGWSGLLYTSPNARYEHKLAQIDVATPCDMRAPGAATGVYALECAMDELAVALDMDPLELRLKCYSERDQNEDLPYTSKQLHECYRQAAEKFGWDKRNPKPRSMRDGTELVGWGMATGVWEALQMKITARIVLTPNGHAEVSCAVTDIGTGTYTIMAQVAAETLGLPIENVSIKLGDSSLPQSPVQGGSWTTASICHAIAQTAETMRADLLKLAKAVPDSPLKGIKNGDAAFVDGAVVSTQNPTLSVSYTDAMRHGGVDRLTAEKPATFKTDSKHARNAHSAVFAEVKIDEQLGVIRVTRIVSAVAAGRIINPQTARSQIMGGMVWGIGMALHEETHTDHRFGRIMNADIAEYHVPVNADVHDIEVIFVEEPDALVNPMGIKGVGEIGIVGVPAAIANAVYHATGLRVRDLPITLDKILPGHAKAA